MATSSAAPRAAFTSPTALRASSLIARNHREFLASHRSCSSSHVAPRRSVLRAAAFRLTDDARVVGEVATARAITPMRRPGSEKHQHHQHQEYGTEEPVLPSGRRTDLMAPARTGVWALVPYVAACVVVGAFGWIGAKRLTVRQKRLVDDFGEVMVYYGNTKDSMREICTDYKGRLGPGIMRGAMFSSFLKNLVTEKPVGPDVIKDVGVVMRLLGVNDAKAVGIINSLGAELKDSPSLLGKLMFVGERCLTPDHVANLNLMTLFPYGESTVVELQRNMVDRCFRDLSGRSLDEKADAVVDVAAAETLRIPVPEAQRMFEEVVVGRIKQAEEERAAVAAAESEDASKPSIADLDYPARSGEPAKSTVHAYQCTQCGYTMFPAAGREFKFYGADFVCPTCGAPKDKFVDLNADE